MDSDIPFRYVVAVSKKEAESLYSYGHDTRPEAEQHLQEVQAPPTDSYYADLYRVYRVQRPAVSTDAG